MNREYLKWYSMALQRDMELLIFGYAGTRVLFFPTRKARFFDYENWGVIEALKDKIEAGLLQVYCVDSIDAESFYSPSLHPNKRMKRHLQFEQYILEEVVALSLKKNPASRLISSGCSLGAYHALNIAFRHPLFFNKVVGMSGRYDLTKSMGTFHDLFEGYVDEDIYLNMPNQFIPDLYNPYALEKLRKLEIVLAVGEQDLFLENNRALSRSLDEREISHQLYIWTEEAHNPYYWRQMVSLYF